TGEQAVDDDDERGDQQQVDEPAEGSQQEPEEPEQEQDDDDGPQHGVRVPHGGVHSGAWPPCRQSSPSTTTNRSCDPSSAISALGTVTAIACSPRAPATRRSS